MAKNRPHQYPKEWLDLPVSVRVRLTQEGYGPNSKKGLFPGRTPIGSPGGPKYPEGGAWMDDKGVIHFGSQTIGGPGTTPEDRARVQDAVKAEQKLAVRKPPRRPSVAEALRVRSAREAFNAKQAALRKKLYAKEKDLTRNWTPKDATELGRLYDKLFSGKFRSWNTHAGVALGKDDIRYARERLTWMKKQSKWPWGKRSVSQVLSGLRTEHAARIAEVRGVVRGRARPFKTGEFGLVRSFAYFFNPLQPGLSRAERARKRALFDELKIPKSMLADAANPLTKGPGQVAHGVGREADIATRAAELSSEVVEHRDLGPNSEQVTDLAARAASGRVPGQEELTPGTLDSLGESMWDRHPLNKIAEHLPSDPKMVTVRQNMEGTLAVLSTDEQEAILKKLSTRRGMLRTEGDLTKVIGQVRKEALDKLANLRIFKVAGGNLHKITPAGIATMSLRLGLEVDPKSTPMDVIQQLKAKFFPDLPVEDLKPALSPKRFSEIAQRLLTTESLTEQSSLIDELEAAQISHVSQLKSTEIRAATGKPPTASAVRAEVAAMDGAQRQKTIDAAVETVQGIQEKIAAGGGAAEASGLDPKTVLGDTEKYLESLRNKSVPKADPKKLDALSEGLERLTSEGRDNVDLPTAEIKRARNRLATERAILRGEGGEVRQAAREALLRKFGSSGPSMKGIVKQLGVKAGLPMLGILLFHLLSRSLMGGGDKKLKEALREQQAGIDSRTTTERMQDLEIKNYTMKQALQMTQGRKAQLLKLISQVGMPKLTSSERFIGPLPATQIPAAQLMRYLGQSGAGG